MLAMGFWIEGYQLRNHLGSGGFGVTYRAVDETLNMPVAIKELFPGHLVYRDGNTVRPKAEKDREVFDRLRGQFLDEARIAASIRHPNVVGVLRFFPGNGTAYLVMTFEEGEELGDFLDNLTQPPDLSTAGRLMLALLDGLAAVHRAGIIHRDIKPANIIVRSKDGSPVLLDFGCARAVDSTRFTVMLSQGYAPIEQYLDGAPQGPWSDVYSLAAVFYRIVTGKKPLAAPLRVSDDPMLSAREATKGRFPDALLSAIDWGLAVNGPDRPQTVDAFTKIIAEALSQPTASASVSPPPVKCAPPLQASALAGSRANPVIAQQINRSLKDVGRQPLANGDVFWTLSILSFAIAAFVIGYEAFRLHARDLVAIVDRHRMPSPEGHNRIAAIVNRHSPFFYAVVAGFTLGVGLVLAGIALPLYHYRAEGHMVRFDLFHDDPLLIAGLAIVAVGMATLLYHLWSIGWAVFDYRNAILGREEQIGGGDEETAGAEALGVAFYRSKVGNVMEMAVLATGACLIGFVAYDFVISATILADTGWIDTKLAVRGVGVSLLLVFMVAALFSLWGSLARELLVHSLFEQPAHWRWRITANVSRAVLAVAFIAIPIIIHYDLFRHLVIWFVRGLAE